MQQAACSAVLAAGSGAAASPALSVPALHKDVCPGCDRRSQGTSTFPPARVSSFTAVGNSAGAVLCPLGACNHGTGAMKAIENDSVNEYSEESREGRSSVEVSSLSVCDSFLQCREDHL